MSEPHSASSVAERVDLVISAAESGTAIDPGVAARLVSETETTTKVHTARSHSWGSIQLDIENSIEYSIEISVEFYRVSYSTANSVEKSIEYSIEFSTSN